MKLKPINRCCIILAVVLFPLVVGCSYLYTVRFDGQLLEGKDCKPVAGAIITLLSGDVEQQTTQTSEDGSWSLKMAISASRFPKNDEGKREYCDLLERQGYKFRITVGDQNVVTPFPRVYAPDSGNDITVSLQTILDPPIQGKSDLQEIQSD